MHCLARRCCDAAMMPPCRHGVDLALAGGGSGGGSGGLLRVCATCSCNVRTAGGRQWRCAADGRLGGGYAGWGLGRLRRFVCRTLCTCRAAWWWGSTGEGGSGRRGGELRAGRSAGMQTGFCVSAQPPHATWERTRGRRERCVADGQPGLVRGTGGLRRIVCRTPCACYGRGGSAGGVRGGCRGGSQREGAGPRGCRRAFVFLRSHPMQRGSGRVGGGNAAWRMGSRDWLRGTGGLRRIVCRTPCTCTGGAARRGERRGECATGGAPVRGDAGGLLRFCAVTPCNVGAGAWEAGTLRGGWAAGIGYAGREVCDALCAGPHAPVRAGRLDGGGVAESAQREACRSAAMRAGFCVSAQPPLATWERGCGRRRRCATGGRPGRRVRVGVGRSATLCVQDPMHLYGWGGGGSVAESAQREACRSAAMRAGFCVSAQPPLATWERGCGRRRHRWAAGAGYAGCGLGGLRRFVCRTPCTCTGGAARRGWRRGECATGGVSVRGDAGGLLRVCAATPCNVGAGVRAAATLRDGWAAGAACASGGWEVCDALCAGPHAPVRAGRLDGGGVAESAQREACRSAAMRAGFCVSAQPPLATWERGCGRRRHRWAAGAGYAGCGLGGLRRFVCRTPCTCTGGAARRGWRREEVATGGGRSAAMWAGFCVSAQPPLATWERTRGTWRAVRRLGGRGWVTRVGRCAAVCLQDPVHLWGARWGRHGIWRGAGGPGEVAQRCHATRGAAVRRAWPVRWVPPSPSIRFAAQAPSRGQGELRRCTLPLAMTVESAYLETVPQRSEALAGPRPNRPDTEPRDPIERSHRRHPAAPAGRHPAGDARSGDAPLLPRLRDERDRGARAARCAGRPEAGAPAHPVSACTMPGSPRTSPTASRRAWSATSWVSSTRTATPRSTTPWCAWRSRSPCGCR